MTPIDQAIEALEAADSVCERIITQDGGILGGVDFHAHRKGIRAALAALSSMPAEPVAKVSESRPVLYSDEYATPPTAPVLTEAEIEALAWNLNAEREYERYMGQESLIVTGAVDFARAIEAEVLRRVGGGV